MTRRFLLVGLTAIALASNGCFQQPLETDPEFLEAAPKASHVEMEVPEGQTSKAYGDIAEMYRNTVQFTRDVNNSVLHWLFFVEIIVTYPPSFKSKTRHEWGPWLPDDGLSSVYLRFVMDKNLDGSFDYALEMKPRDQGDEAFLPVFYGTVDPGASIHRSQGVMHFDFDTAASMDLAVQEAGSITIYHDTNIGNKDIFIQFHDFRGKHDDQGFTASYHYDADPGGSGYFDWVVDGDIHADDPNGGAYPNNETLSLRSRWNAAGDGRADALVTGPDLDAQNIDSYQITECWDSSFASTYYEETWTVGGQAHTSPNGWGSAVECTFTDFQQPQF